MRNFRGERKHSQAKVLPLPRVIAGSERIMKCTVRGNVPRGRAALAGGETRDRLI